MDKFNFSLRKYSLIKAIRFKGLAEGNPIFHTIWEGICGDEGAGVGLRSFSLAFITSSAFSPYSSFTQFEREFVGVGGLTWGCGHIGLESFSSPLLNFFSLLPVLVHRHHLFVDQIYLDFYWLDLALLVLHVVIHAAHSIHLLVWVTIEQKLLCSPRQPPPPSPPPPSCAVRAGHLPHRLFHFDSSQPWRKML